MPDRKVSPPIKDAIDYHISLKKPEIFKLDNGVTVYNIHAGTERVVQLEWVFKAGNWYEKKNNVAAAANFLLKNGTTKHNAYEINEYVDFYGAYLNRTCYNETASITLHCLSHHLEQLLPMVREILTDAVLPDQELQIFKQNMKQKLSVNLRKCDFVAGRKIDALLFGEKHPYGIYSELADYDALNREELLEHYHHYYRNGHCIVFSAGILPDNYAVLMNQYFGDLPLNTRLLEEVEHDIVKDPQQKWNILNDPDGVQAAIRIARPFPTRKHPDFPKVQVLNAVFGGFFGSRLMTNIREDKGYTYGIYSFLVNHIHAGAWMISTEAGRDVAAATVNEVYHEMQQLREKPVDQEELLLVKNYLIGTLLGDLDGPFQIIGRWKNLILNDLDDSFFYHSVDTIKTIGAKELQELANQYLQPDQFHELVVV
ncbi:MAG: insulinase family protein [Chitinophagia bacterium]|nr:insulinase family protein [Chitinophagia bacterium]